ncbi:MAG: hypothetical protein M3Y33_03520 [Actinomycetota bacterium]|nr:hypothetical protein [Actinomycetota bacterium]
MSEPAQELPADAESLARRGVLTHLTVNGERVALIVPASLMDTLRILAELLASPEESARLAVLLPAVYPWARYLPDYELKAFAFELRDALRDGGADAPELMERVVIGWRGTAEVHADPDLFRAVTAEGSDYGPVPEPAAP